MSEKPQVIYLKDYQVPAFSLQRTELYFTLHDGYTCVKTALHMQRNTGHPDPRQALFLDGDKSLELKHIAINGKVLNHYERTDTGLLVAEVPERFVLETEVLIYPDNNTALEGLYRSEGIYCTQCEAEGFRRITFYPDRPDVLSTFTTTIEADKSRYPVLLSNGNPVATGESDDGARHWITWEDPFPKPAYLFALVAGELSHVEERFTTASGREVALKIYADQKDLNKLDHAMLSLKNSMRWDEQVYGREYDLDIYMIVAVDFFNMGAMENKGLNIFNTSCVLANPDTTTDAGFQRVEAVVAHEYFHNWSGNRVTCRDWFQLSLKEGFTVFRDAQFSADMNSHTVKRIEDVALLRTAQFAEDAGPMAHPVRPDSFIEISNFYTLTVYEKGSEVVRMLHTLLGAELFRQGTDLYFERHDGQAVTTDDFVAVMEEVSGRDLTQFKRWYSQAGTPVLEVTDHYNAQEATYQLSIRQSCPPTPEKQNKAPFHIPIAVGLLDAQGNAIALANGADTQVLELTESIQTFHFTNVPQTPVPSLLRGFSAPVKLHYPYSREQRIFLMQHDTDGFNRWEAAQQLGVDILQGLIQDYRQGKTMQLDSQFVAVYQALLQQQGLDPAMLAKTLTLPTEGYLSELAGEIDSQAIHHTREFVRAELGRQLQPDWLACYQQYQLSGDYQSAAAHIAKRALKNTALAYLVASGREEGLALAESQYETANNMTDRLAALAQVVHYGTRERSQPLLSDYYHRWQSELLVVDLWLSVQATNPACDTLEHVKTLMTHESFNLRNPNKVRSLIGAFCGQNAVNFHAESGAGYRFLADCIIQLNALNPQIASRLLTPLTRWRRYDGQRQQLMRAELERILTTDQLAPDLFEVVSKSLA